MDSKNTYKPTFEHEELECDEDAYNILNCLKLDLPSQSICIHNNYIVYCKMADNSFKTSKLCIIHADDFESQNVEAIEEFDIDFYVNRIRNFNNSLILLGDSDLAIFENKKFWKFPNTQNFKFGFGLCVFERKIYAGTSDGKILVLTEKMEIDEIIEMHKSQIDSIVFYDKEMYSSSSKGGIYKNKKLIFENTTDVNSLDIKSNLLVFGDEEGSIGIINGNVCYKINDWHKSSIECIKFNKNVEGEEVLFACSEEQVSMWDLSLENEEKIIFNTDIKISDAVTETVEVKNNESFLLFVHQGFRQYKDIDFLNTIAFNNSRRWYKYV
ncbi:hypothetical protein EHP00_1100 [Ecytonucleospora hepatopenaei]|uniref:Uncharacterized protein n=1 Tax=Ecytonucleospora hepatopenaei TaxID=646526 RepID=A0A1W0E355_9MICR|nr:hypothetical protein EHP00_1100 [Ecytonucleospora hepatopenaei]